MRDKIKISFIVIIIFFLSGNFFGYAREWHEYRGTHFIIYYKHVPEDLVKTVADTAEQYYQEVTTNLGFNRVSIWKWDNRAKIYIYNDAEDYYKSAKEAQWSQGAAHVKTKVIRTYPTMQGFFDTILPHELGHIVFREFIGYYTWVPLWFEEGVAMYQEKAKRWGVNGIVKKLLKENRFIPLEKLTKMRLYRNTPKETVDIFYTEAGSAVYFLITKFGRYRFARFCRRLKNGVPFEKALYDVYYRFKNIDDLNKAWVAYIKDQD